MVFPNLTDKNNKIDAKLKALGLKSLPSIIKNNIGKRSIKVYDSGWITSNTLTQNSEQAVFSRAEPVHHVISVIKTLNLQIPDSLIPFVKVNIIVNPGPGAQTIGMSKNNNRPTKPAYRSRVNINDVFSGILDDFPMPSDYPYATFLYKKPVWIMDLHYTTFEALLKSENRNFRIRKATVCDIQLADSKWYKYPTGEFIDVYDRPHVPSGTLVARLENTVSGDSEGDSEGNELDYETCKSTEIIEANSTDVTFRGIENVKQQIWSEDDTIDNPFPESQKVLPFTNFNVERKFLWSQVKMNVWGRGEMLFDDGYWWQWGPRALGSPFESNILVGYHGETIDALVGHQDAGFYTYTVSNVSLYGYYPCLDENTHLRIAKEPGLEYIAATNQPDIVRSIPSYLTTYGVFETVPFDDNVFPSSHVELGTIFGVPGGPYFQGDFNNWKAVWAEYDEDTQISGNLVTSESLGSILVTPYQDHFRLAGNYFASSDEQITFFKNGSGNYTCNINSNIAIKATPGDAGILFPDTTIYSAYGERQFPVKIRVDIINPFYYSEENRVNKI